MFEAASDFDTVGQNPLTARRYYNSNVAYAAAWNGNYTPTYNPGYSFLNSRFGYAWRSEYDRFIIPNNANPNSATVVDAIRADGEPVHFAKSGSTWYVAYWTNGGWSLPTDPRHDINIRVSTDGQYWYIIDDQDTVDKYAADGRLLTVTFRNGYQQTLTYDADNQNSIVSDSIGRSITFNYQPCVSGSCTGLVTSIIDADGNTTQYAYSTVGNYQPPAGTAAMYLLQQVTHPDNTNTTYSYDDPNPINLLALTGIIDENNNTYAKWTYDRYGRATSSQLAGGANLTRIDYDDTNATRTVTTALGKQFVYSFNTFQNQFQISGIAGLASAHTAASINAFQYDTDGFVQLSTSAENRQVYYQHNSIGQQTQRVDGYGSPDARTINTQWNSTYNVPDQIDYPGLLRINFYYTGGLLDHLTETDETSQSVPYSTNGETRTWAFGYLPSGLLHTIDGPLTGTADTITYDYNQTGFVSKITDELGHITQITAWNARGEPLTSIDPNNVTTSYTYDKRGRIKTITTNPGSDQALTSINYDSAGNVQVIVAPDGASLTYGYDGAHRLQSVTDNSGNSVTFVLDALGDITQTLVKRGIAPAVLKLQSALFDELGRIIRNIGAADQTTQHAYDRDDNEVQTVDPRSKVYAHAFDALNRLYQETDPDLDRTTVGYNGRDEIVSVSDPRMLTTSYVRDGFGNPIQVTSPDAGTSVFYYDELENVLRKIDARGVELDYTYDAKGRLTTRKVHGTNTENVTFSYDVLNSHTFGINRLRQIADSTGSTTFSYDPLGFVTMEKRIIQTQTYETSFTNDPAGNLLTVTYPSGRIVTYTRDSLGHISGITTQQNSGAPIVTLVANATYMPFGPLNGFQFGNGIALAEQFDRDYQLTAIDTSTSTQYLTYAYDAAGNVLGITDHLSAARNQSFGYDDLNRLNAATGAYGSQSYTYDGSGNRTSRTTGSLTETYNISPTSNQISSIVAGANTRSFNYLSTGQLSNDIRDPSDTYRYNYNNTGRMTSATLNGNSNVVGTYQVNGAEQRVAKTVGTATTHFIFDRFGHLLAEANGATGATLREYIWLDDLPVAIVDDTGASPVVYYIHADHLGTPQKVTDSSANIVWDAVFDPFGNASSIGGTVTLNLRFPGQYFDAETGLAQNWNRDYDASIGRYIESDPIGLLGGINTYAYVRSNPLRRTDPNGEGALGCILGGTVGGLLGGGGGTLVEPGGGTIVGGVAGVEEGCDIGSGAETALRLLQLANSGAKKSPGCSDDDFCYQRWEVEDSACYQWRGLGSRAVAACRQRAADRRNLCIRNGGKPHPEEPPVWSPFRDYPR